MNPDHIAAMAKQLHTAECVALYAVQPRWRPEHHDRDHAKAERILTGLALDGYHLTPKEDR